MYQRAAIFFVLLASPCLLFGQWEKINTLYHAAPNQLQSFGNQLFCTTREGVYRSNDTGQTWEFLTKALCCNNGYQHFLNINPANKYYYFINEEDYQISVGTDEGKNWQPFGVMPVSTPFFERHRGLLFKSNDVYTFQQNYVVKKEIGGTLNG